MGIEDRIEREERAREERKAEADRVAAAEEAEQSRQMAHLKILTAPLADEAMQLILAQPAKFTVQFLGPGSLLTRPFRRHQTGGGHYPVVERRARAVIVDDNGRFNDMGGITELTVVTRDGKVYTTSPGGVVNDGPIGIDFRDRVASTAWCLMKDRDPTRLASNLDAAWRNWLEDAVEADITKWVTRARSGAAN